MRKLLTVALAVIALAAFTGLGVAQENPATQERKIEKKAIVESKPQVQRWGSATLTMTDDKGITTTKTEKYPIVDKATTQEFKSCWNWCEKVCDGYGVCWLSCGLSCSPWWPKNVNQKSLSESSSKEKTSCSCKSGDGKKSCSVSCKEGESAYCDCDDTTASCTCN